MLHTCYNLLHIYLGEEDIELESHHLWPVVESPEQCVFSQCECLPRGAGESDEIQLTQQCFLCRLSIAWWKSHDNVGPTMPKTTHLGMLYTTYSSTYG